MLDQPRNKFPCTELWLTGFKPPRSCLVNRSYTRRCSRTRHGADHFEPCNFSCHEGCDCIGPILVSITFAIAFPVRRVFILPFGIGNGAVQSGRQSLEMPCNSQLLFKHCLSLLPLLLPVLPGLQICSLRIVAAYLAGAILS